MSDIQLEIQRKLNPHEELERGVQRYKKGYTHSIYIFGKFL